MDNVTTSGDVIEIKDASELFFEEAPYDYFTFDSRSRKITIPASFVTLGVESDDSSERVWFEGPRIVGDNIDLTTRNIYINYQNANGEKDSWYVEDIVAEDDIVHFSWKIERKVVAYKGNVTFLICALTTDEEGKVETEWHTSRCTAPVLEGLEVENPAPPAEEYDLINQLIDVTKKSIKDVTDTCAQTIEELGTKEQEAINNIAEKETNSIAAVEKAKNDAVGYIGNGLDSTLTKQGIAAESQAVGDAILKARIVDRASGELISLSDSAEAPLQSMKIFGKTIQNGIPTPKIPIELVSIGDDGNLSITCGKNILPYPYTTGDSPWYTNNEDKSVTVNIDNGAFVYFTLYEGSPLSTGVAKIALSGQYYNIVIYCKILDNKGNELYFENSPSSLTIDFREYPSDARVKIGIRNASPHASASGTVYPAYMTDFSECSVAIAPLRRIVGTDIRDEIDTARKVRVQRVGRAIVTEAVGTFESTLEGVSCTGCRCEITNFHEWGKVCSNRYSQYVKGSGVANNIIRWDSIPNTIRIYDSRIPLRDIAKANEILSKEKPEVLYELAEPIETPLSDEEIEAYKALYTYYPKTFIYNSENTDMEVEYVADTKNYVDNKITDEVAKLTAAIITE